MVNDTADEIAANHGFVSFSGSIRSSSSACAASGSKAVSSVAAWRAVCGERPLASYRPRQFVHLGIGLQFQLLAFSCTSIARSVSRWVLTDTYSPTAIDSAPAASPAMPAVSTGPRSAVAAATPITMPAVETIPSLAPKTAARSQLSLLATEPWCGSGLLRREVLAGSGL